jgi:hypothetical protein
MCYVAPLAAAITTNFIWRKKKTLEFWWLFLMFCGGSVFGVIDHLWNGELFLISKDWLKDLGLGIVICAVTILAWKAVSALAKRNPALAS